MAQEVRDLRQETLDLEEEATVRVQYGANPTNGRLTQGASARAAAAVLRAEAASDRAKAMVSRAERAKERAEALQRRVDGTKQV